MESGQLMSKFELLFEKISDPKYVLNSYYADNLLNKLSSPDSESQSLLESQQFADLVLEKWDKTINCTNSVKVFTIRLLAVISKKELQFSKFLHYPAFKIFDGLTTMSHNDIPANIRVAYMELALALVSHRCGVSWLLSTEVWKIIFEMCSKSQTVFVLRTGYKFIADFLWKLSDANDETNLIPILEHILKPIIESPYHKVQSFTKTEEIAQTTRFDPSLNMIMCVLKDTYRICKSSVLIKLLIKHFSLDYCLFAILTVTRREDIMLLISKITFSLVFAKLFLTNPLESSEHNFLDLSVVYFNILHLLIKRGRVIIVLDFCIVCNIVWSEVWSNHTPPSIKRNGKTFHIQNQLIFPPIVPILAYIKKNRGSNKDDLFDTYITNYITKLLNISCEHTTRVAYAMRDLMYENDPQTVALQSIRRFFSLKNHLDNSQANIIFQALFYLLKDQVPFDEAGSPLLTPEQMASQERVLVLSYVTDAILMLLRGHSITWQESFEILCLYNQMSDILKMPNLPCKFQVQVLSMMNLLVKRFLVPNLTLLMESRTGSAIHDIGTLIYSKMHDPNWEIRDSALELLHVCTEISFVKYTPFQKKIMESDLLSLTVTIALNDSEFYVQASALKCLSAACKVAVLWEDVIIKHPQLYMQLISIVNNNPEGIVRKEAANTLSEIFLKQVLPQHVAHSLYSCMATVALYDLHWEVQLGALKFWKIVIQKQLADQGMLDGKFPYVTFSKEKRKIVTLDEIEIQKRLIKVLNKLAPMGCLSVLVGLLQDDVSTEVMDASLTISKYIIALLDRYKVIEVPDTCAEVSSNGHFSVDPDKDGTLTDKHDEDTPMSEDIVDSDDIIKGIIEADDLNLLASIYEQQLKLKSTDETPSENELNIRKKAVELVSPSAFVKAIKETDYAMLIEEKKKWKESIQSLHSLLDDILGLYETSEVNNLDCY